MSRDSQHSNKNLASLDDESLMERVRDHECKASFTQLFQRWKEPLLRASFRMTGVWQDAEDCAQEVFGKLYRSRSSYQRDAAFKTFLWTIAINQTRDLARRKKRDVKESAELMMSIAATSTDVGSHLETKDAVQNALMKLPESLREIVVLRHFQGLKFREIADLCSLPQGTVASRMAKALILLKLHLVPPGHETTTLENGKPDHGDGHKLQLKENHESPE